MTTTVETHIDINSWKKSYGSMRITPYEGKVWFRISQDGMSAYVVLTNEEAKEIIRGLELVLRENGVES